MANLKRFLKPRHYQPFLEQAADLAGDGVRMAMISDGRVLGLPGVAEEDFLQAGAGAVRAPLRAMGQDFGHLVLLPGPDGGTEQLVKLADFLASVFVEFISRESARRALAAETLDRYREIELLDRASVSLNNSLRLREVTRALLDECKNAAVPAEMGAVFIRDPKTSIHQALNSYGPTEECGLERITESRLFTEIIDGGYKGEIVNDLDNDERWEDEVPLIQSVLVVPLFSQSLSVGALVLASTDPTPFQAQHLKYISILSSVAGIAMGNAHHFESVQILMNALIQALATAIDARDPFTAGHSQRVANLAVAMARVVNHDDRYFTGVRFSDNEMNEIYYAGLLHDVGKIGVREQVLTKSSRLPHARLEVIGKRLALFALESRDRWEDDYRRLEIINTADRLEDDDLSFIREMAQRWFDVNGESHRFLADDEIHHLNVREGNLTPEERLEIQRHPEESRRILQHIPLPDNFSKLLTIIHQHHERLDGSGYPVGEHGESILLESRILAIVDIYDAMTQERHYKSAMSSQEAMGVLRAEAERGKIDSRLVELFCSKVDTIERHAKSVNELLGLEQTASLARLGDDSAN